MGVNSVSDVHMLHSGPQSGPRDLFSIARGASSSHLSTQTTDTYASMYVQQCMHVCIHCMQKYVHNSVKQFSTDQCFIYIYIYIYILRGESAILDVQYILMLKPVNVHIMCAKFSVVFPGVHYTT